MTSSEPDPKEVAHRYVEVALNDGDGDAMDEILTEHHVDHDPTGDGEEPLAEFTAFVQGYHQAFTDLHFAVDTSIAEGDLVSSWGRTTGTHEGALMGIESTGDASTAWGSTSSASRTGRSPSNGRTSTASGCSSRSDTTRSRSSDGIRTPDARPVQEPPRLLGASTP